MGIIHIRRIPIIATTWDVSPARRVIMTRGMRRCLILRLIGMVGIRRIVSAIWNEETLPHVHFAGAPDAVEVGDEPGIRAIKPTDVEQGFPPLNHVIEGAIGWGSSSGYIGTKQALTCQQADEHKKGDGPRRPVHSVPP